MLGLTIIKNCFNWDAHVNNLSLVNIQEKASGELGNKRSLFHFDWKRRLVLKRDPLLGYCTLQAIGKISQFQLLSQGEKINETQDVLRT